MRLIKADMEKREFELCIEGRELSFIRAALSNYLSMLHKKAANCTACGMEAVEVRYLLEKIREIMKEAR